MNQAIGELIQRALAEDLSTRGDVTSLACFDGSETSKAGMIAKEPMVVAGLEVARAIFQFINPDLDIEVICRDGQKVEKGATLLTVEGDTRSILSAERTVLNMVQRMSGIATKTNQMVTMVEGTGVKILDTRKTTPTLRYFEKWAVKIGGGENHRFGLYDMVMIKDNHSDFCGGAEFALQKVKRYLKENSLDLQIVVEARSIEEVKRILDEGGADRMLLDNFTPEGLAEAVRFIGGRVATEASGGITEENLRAYALSRVNYISSGALTHSVKSMDISLKAII